MLFCITNHCEEECPHCMSSCSPNGQHASAKVVNGFIKFAKKMGTTKLCVSGGEPTQHPKFFRSFKQIVDTFNNKALIVLMSNGFFLRHENIIANLVKLQKQKTFSIQISAMEHFYPNWIETTNLFNLHKDRFASIELVTYLTHLEEYLGRAKDRNWDDIKPSYERKGPNCFNLYSIAQSSQIHNLRQLIQFMDRNLTFSFCKPMIDYKGDVRPGESMDCPVIGNVFDKSNLIFNNLKENQPCGKCKVQVPDVAKLQFGWK